MRGVISDHDIEGHFRALVDMWDEEPWREIWASLNLAVEDFASLGISPHMSDAELWHVCQSRELVLFTANRNNDGPDSLQATIAQFSQMTSLPVITLAKPDRFNEDREYAARVAERALQYLLEIENHRGTGRMYL